MCHDFHVLGRVATMDTATQHSKLSYQNYLEYTKCVRAYLVLFGSKSFIILLIIIWTQHYNKIFRKHHFFYEILPVCAY